MTSSRVDPVTPHEDQWQQSAWRSRLRKGLLAWFGEHARSLPWRTHPDPYWVWVSEIMCQQTQIATVVPYFHRFIAEFPTIQSLAAADPSRLMQLWEGLGYYRRARSLHAAAVQIVARHGGVFPTSYDDVIALPGIGRYTAGAILSISGDQRLPILEGNTIRVFSRLIGLRVPPADPAANRLLWEVAGRVLPQTGSGTFNQAAMELGALVCTPKQPRCLLCPVRGQCAAYRSGLQAAIPGKVTHGGYLSKREFAFVIASPRRGGAAAYLMRPAPPGGRWAGLWDFPRCTDDGIDDLSGATEWLAGQLQRQVVAGRRITTIRHAVTKYRIELSVHAATIAGAALRARTPWRFVTVRQMADLPLSVTGRKITKLLVNQT